MYLVASFNYRVVYFCTLVYFIVSSVIVSYARQRAIGALVLGLYCYPALISYLYFSFYK